MDLLIRATQPRLIEVADPSGPRTLQEAAAQAAVVGRRTVKVHAQPNQAARQAELTVRRVEVFVRAPKNNPKPAPASVGVRVVYAREATPPAGVEHPLEWILLTTLPLSTPQEALVLLDDYAFRWLIERFHFVLKSGCRFERLQLDSFVSLHKALSLYSIVAWRLLYLTYLGRQVPDAAAEEAVSGKERQLLELTSGQAIITVEDALLAVAKLGGFVRVTSAPLPGVKSLWIGFRKLQDMLAGFLLAQQPSSSA